MARKRIPNSLLAVTAAAGIVFVAASASHAAGRFNLPANLAQYLGYGHGAGYHAPLVLGTPVINHQPRYRVKRVLHSPMGPTYTHGFSSGVTVIEGPARSYSPTQAPAQSQMPAQSQAPTQSQAPWRYAPTPAAPRPDAQPAYGPASPSDLGAPNPEAIPLPR